VEEVLRKMGKKIDEFFVHLVAYGGFNLNNGIITVWHDPSIFLPLSSFATLEHEIISTLNKDGKELLYWAGKVYGRYCTIAMITRFGFDIKDLDKFASGTTQDGFGFITILKILPNRTDLKEGLFSGTNSQLAIQYKKMYGPTKEGIDYYVCGLLTGGSEPLAKRNGTGKEIKCMAKGDKECIYHLKETNKEEMLQLLKKIKVDEKKLLKKALNLYLKRNNPPKLISKRNISFGDGSFILEGKKGIIFAVFSFCILNYILYARLGKKYLDIIDKVSKETVEVIYEPKLKSKIMNKDSINKWLGTINILGLGEFRLLSLSTNKILVENNNNPLASDYKMLFGISKQPIDYYSKYLLKHLFEKYLNKKIRIEEIKCAACGQSKCIFSLAL